MTMPTVGTVVFLTADEPFLVVLADKPTLVIAVEGEISDVSPAAVCLIAHRLLRHDWSEYKGIPFVTMRATVTVPYRHVLGMVTIPQKAKQ